MAKQKTEARPVHCVVCVNTGNYAADPRGVTAVNDHVACPDHTALVSQPGFDVFQLRRDQGEAV